MYIEEITISYPLTVPAFPRYGTEQPDYSFCVIEGIWVDDHGNKQQSIVSQSLLDNAIRDGATDQHIIDELRECFQSRVHVYEATGEHLDPLATIYRPTP